MSIVKVIIITAEWDARNEILIRCCNTIRILKNVECNVLNYLNEYCKKILIKYAIESDGIIKIPIAIIMVNDNIIKVVSYCENFCEKILTEIQKILK